MRSCGGGGTALILVFLSLRSNTIHALWYADVDVFNGKE